MEYPKVCLRRGEESGVLKGQRLIYDNELDWADDICTDGCVVDVLDSRQRFAARGFFNSNSRLAVRVLTRDEAEPIDRAFFARRIEAAWHTRQALGFSDSCRVVFGESDGLPGLTVDKFADCLSFQIACLGLEQWKPELVSILAELFTPRGIYERDDLPVREKEGLPLIKTCVYGEVPEELVIREHDARMLVSIANGQKTGHFLDQQENRGRLKPYAPGQDVLDLCCCTGGFSIHAALYGAKSVEAVDVSEDALALVRRNAALNGVQDIVTTTCANVFDLARQYVREGRQYGLVVCDPPAFAKSRKALENAYRGYKELNLQCMKLVRPGGYLVSCSCSQFMTPELFLKMLREAAQDAGQLIGTGIDAQTGLGHPAQPQKNRGLGRALVFQGDADDALFAIFDDLIILYVSLVNKNLGNSLLHVGSGDIHRIVLGRVCVPDSRQHVGNGIGDLHSVNLL